MIISWFVYVLKDDWKVRKTHKVEFPTLNIGGKGGQSLSLTTHEWKNIMMMAYCGALTCEKKQSLANDVNRMSHVLGKPENHEIWSELNQWFSIVLLNAIIDSLGHPNGNQGWAQQLETWPFLCFNKLTQAIRVNLHKLKRSISPFTNVGFI